MSLDELPFTSDKSPEEALAVIAIYQEKVDGAKAQVQYLRYLGTAESLC